MANRIPTFVDATSEKISEVPAGDFLSIEGSGLAEGHIELSGDNVVADLSSASSFSITLTESTTVAFANPPESGACGFTFEVIQDAGDSGFIVSWPLSVAWVDATVPTLSSGANKKDVFVFINTYVNSGSSGKYIGMIAGKNI